MGRNWFKPFRISIQGIYSIVYRGKKNQIVNEFKELFQTRQLSALRVPPVKLELKPGINPVFFRARPVPIPLRDRVNVVLDQMIKDGTFEPTDFSSWATPVVPVLKRDGTIRICIDYRSTVNAAVKRNAYPLPAVQEMLATITGGILFTQLDLEQAYYQLPVDEESAEILTINTSRGLLKVKRLPQGLSASPGIFQKFMETLIAGIDGVVVFIDDVLISGRDEVEHDDRLRQVLKRMEGVGMHLKLDKCRIAVTELEFLGFMVTSSGIKPSNTKVKAIHDAPYPTNKEELQAFLGLLNFYSCFLKDKATIAEPLHKLLNKNMVWTFGKKEKEAFEGCKLLLQSEDLLAHYDPDKQLILVCDASPYGVGAVLAIKDEQGQEKPIAFGSRTLSRAERNYGQVDKEGLAVIFGVTKFQKFLLGRNFSIFTDHKPLLGIFKQEKPIPQTVSPRMLRWSLILSAYSYDLQYRPGKELGNADGLSRLPIPSMEIDAEDPPEPADVFFLEYEDAPYSVRDIAVGTRKDATLSKVKNWVVNGRSGVESSKPEFHSYISRFNELSVSKDCVLWSNRVVIPEALRLPLLRELHLHHPGIVAMKALARCYVWWPRMDYEIEMFVKNCRDCQATRHASPTLRNSFWARPDRKWSRIHIDFLGPVNGKYFLIVIDAYSKWLEVIPTTTMVSAVVIKGLRNIFATHGVPEYVVSDNATNFTSEEFKNFTTKNGIKQIFSPPYHPSSNGMAERSVQTVKDALRRLDWSKLEVELARFLLMYRNTPKRSTGKSPAEIMFGKRVRTVFDNLHPDRNTELEEQNWSNHRRFEDKDAVWERKEKGKWTPAEIIAKTGNMMYRIKCQDGTVASRHMDQLRTREGITGAEDTLSGSKEVEKNGTLDGNLLQEPIEPWVLKNNIGIEGNEMVTDGNNGAKAMEQELKLDKDLGEENPQLIEHKRDNNAEVTSQNGKPARIRKSPIWMKDYVK